MRIPRKKIGEAIKYINDNQNIKYIHYREIHKEIRADNFHISTKVDFKKVEGNWRSLRKKLIFDYEYKSKTGSKYIVTKGGTVYRYSNHWGAISSCEWTLEGKGQLMMSIFDAGDWEIGKAHLSEFKLFRRKTLPKKDYIVNPVWKNYMDKNIEPILKIVESLKNDESFATRPIYQKKYIGVSRGILKKALII